MLATTRYERKPSDAHHHLRLHLAHRVERDADHDQKRRRRGSSSSTTNEELDEERRHDGHEREVDEPAAASAPGRGTAPSAARADARDVPAVLAEVVGLVDRVELDGRVEVREEDDEEGLEHEEAHVRRAEPVVDEVLRLREELRDRRREGEHAAAKMIWMTSAMFTRSGM